MLSSLPSKLLSAIITIVVVFPQNIPGARSQTFEPTIKPNPEHLKRLLETRNCPKCDLRGADLRWANLRGADLRGADLRNTQLGEANLDESNLEKADLRGAEFVNSVPFRRRYEGSHGSRIMEGNSFRPATIRNANMRSANLSGTNLSDVKMREADLSNANLERVRILPFTDLTGVSFKGANLKGAEIGVAIEDSKLCGAILPNGEVSKKNCEE